jgi:hypothetical protein
MNRKSWLLAAVGAFGLALGTAPVEASPLGGMAEAQRAAAAGNGVVQDVRWVRQCWRHRGHLHCRQVWRDDGPSFRFYFRDGRGHHHRHRHHNHHH